MLVKNRFYLLFILIIFLFQSCEKDLPNGKIKDNSEEKWPTAPEAVNYDINGDSIDDIQIDYLWSHWDGVNCYGYSLMCIIRSLGNNSILQKRNTNTLVNKKHDTISINIDEPFYWEESDLNEIVSISGASYNDPFWSEHWELNSDLHQDYYYLGLKIIKENKQLIGWIKLEIDKSLGTVQIVDKDYTSESYIVLDK